MRRSIWLVLLSLWLLAVPSAAQTPEAVVSWDVEFFLAGVNPATGSPIQTANFTKAASACNQAKVSVPGGTLVNPGRIVLDDPDVANRDCVLGPNAAVTIGSLPFGVAHFATSRTRGVTTVSDRSAASNPFSRVSVPLPPAVPTGLRVVP